MNSRIKNMRDGGMLGGLLGGAIGTLLNGVAFAIPGGGEIVIARALCTAVAAATKIISVSGTAVGTIIGAAAGAAVKPEQGR